jgi:hypothetical protein
MLDWHVHIMVMAILTLGIMLFAAASMPGTITITGKINLSEPLSLNVTPYYSFMQLLIKEEANNLITCFTIGILFLIFTDFFFRSYFSFKKSYTCGKYVPIIVTFLVIIGDELTIPVVFLMVVLINHIFDWRLYGIYIISFLIFIIIDIYDFYIKPCPGFWLEKLIHRKNLAS